MTTHPKETLAQLVMSTYSLPKVETPEEEKELLTLVLPVLEDIAKVLVSLPEEEFQDAVKMVDDSFKGRHSPLSRRATNGQLYMHHEARARLAEFIFDHSDTHKFLQARHVLEGTPLRATLKGPR